MAKIKDSYLKKSWVKLLKLFNLFYAGLDIYGVATFGLPVAEVDSLKAKIDKTKTSHDASDTAKAASKAATVRFTTDRDDAIKSVRETVNRIKASTPYTIEIGKIMGIEGEEQEYDPSAMKPALKVFRNAGKIEIDFIKSFSEGINIYSRRADETEFTFLARDTESPYVDNRPNLAAGKAETRQYYAYYIFDDEEQGHRSETYDIAVVD